MAMKKAVEHTDMAMRWCPGSERPVERERPEIGDGICAVCGLVVGVI